MIEGGLKVRNGKKRLEEKGLTLPLFLLAQSEADAPNSTWIDAIGSRARETGT